MAVRNRTARRRRPAQSEISFPGPTSTHQEADVLRLLLQRLDRYRRVVIVAADALRKQNCDHDADVAEVLSFFVADPIFQLQEDAGRLIAALGGKHGPDIDV